MTVAITGPTQGAHSSPIPAPNSRPVARSPREPSRIVPPASGMRVERRASQSAARGKASNAPATTNTPAAASRSGWVVSPMAASAAAITTVVATNVTANPAITAATRTSRPVPAPPSTSGRIGSEQGPSAVRAPATTATMSRPGITDPPVDAAGADGHRPAESHAWVGPYPPSMTHR